jgi:hypothetical protein
MARAFSQAVAYGRIICFGWLVGWLAGSRLKLGGAFAVREQSIAKQDEAPEAV